MDQIRITEKFLMEAGGWKAIKHAKALLELGRVISANYTPPILRGLVREGEIEYSAGLKIRSRTEIENLCSCRESRNWGAICAHSLALGLSVILPKLARSEQAAPPANVRRPVFLAQENASSAGRATMQSDARWVELHVVLTPNIEMAWTNGQVTVGFEVISSGKRLLASALDPDLSYACAEVDCNILEWVRDIANGGMPGMTILARDHFLQLLRLLIGHQRITLGRKIPVRVLESPFLPKLLRSELPDGQWKIGIEQIQGKLLVGTQSAWLCRESEFRPVSPGVPAAYLTLLKEPILLSSEQGNNFVQHELQGLKNFFQCDCIGLPETAAGIPEVHATFEGSLNHLSAKLQCLYGNRLVTLGVTSPAKTFFYRENGSLRSRNLDYEKKCVRRLQAAGFGGPSALGEYVLRGENSILKFFADELGRLQKDWKVSVGSRFQNVTRAIERVGPRLEILGSGENWFDFSFALEGAGGTRFSAAEVQRLLQVGRSFTRLKDGRLAVFDPSGLQEFEAVLQDCNPIQVCPGTYRIERNQAGYLDAAFRELAGSEIQGVQEWDRWTRSQRQLVPFESAPLGSLEAILRPYQKEGVFWLRFLSRNGLGGILADEMGLGKTLQTLAFLRLLRGTSLVVCPSSLLFNWAREAEKFVPELKVLSLEGPDRGKQFARIPSSDLVLTSYPLLRRDIDQYRQFEFAAIILDEATHIKNPYTQNAQAAIALRGSHRFVLTGTPIENSVRDLWSLLQFVIPGYLGRREDFRERYELPINRGSEPLRARLAKRLRPVMLRRLKRQVIQDLPEKLEQTAFCELSPEQFELYRKLQEEGRRKLDELSGAKDQVKARITILTALLRLRQVCCDLRLLGEGGDRPSAKMELLAELLQEAGDGGHRALIFSQFVSMLGLIRAELDQIGMPFCYLDGNSRDRAAQVDRFQQSDSIPVFLISLKAGGLGLNLSAADTVIHFDPWWNPAVEAQATDRAHRIGQTRVVTSYKLIARGTVEEKILNLQRKKQALTETMVESDEPLMTGLSLAEMSELLTG